MATLPLDSLVNAEDIIGDTHAQVASSGSTAIGTPLQKALDAAAALALVAPTSQEVPHKLALNEVPFEMSHTAAPIIDGNSQQKWHAHRDDDSPTTSSLSGVPKGTSTPELGADCTHKKDHVLSMKSISLQTQAIAPRPVATNAPAPSLLHPILPDLVPGSFQELRAAMKSAQVPPIFRDQPYRSGKWTKEEEVYADTLIELFDKGQVDERNGSSLRGFLSRKLHCTPMRISKKYAGKGIGKLVFSSKNIGIGFHAHIGQDSRRAAEYQENMQRLKEAEEAFYRNCCPERFNRQGVPYIIAVPGYLPVAPACNTQFAALSMLPPVTSAISHVPVVGVSSLPRPCLPPAVPVPIPVVQSVASPVPIPVVQSVASHSVATSTDTPPTIWAQVPVAGVAWKQYPTPQQPFGSSPPPPLPVQSVTAAPAVALTKPVSTYTQFLEQAYIGVARAMHSHSIQASTVLSTPPATTTTSFNAKAGLIDHVATAVYGSNEHQMLQDATKTDTRPMGVSVPQPDINELPDFAAGFDRVQASPQKAVPPPATIAEDDPSQFSPTYTSRSFDDFHRLLGTNLSPGGRRHIPNLGNLQMPDETARNHSIPPAIGGMQGLPSPRLLALPIHPRQSSQEALQRAYCEAMAWGSRAPLPSNPADSYTIVAQQGAFAASQHSAYFAGKGGLEGDDLSMLLMEINQKPASSTRDAYSTSPGANQDECFLMSRSGFPTVSAEPSDQGSDEANQASGTDSTPSDGSNDSDGSCSASSRKKARVAMEEGNPSSMRTMQWGVANHL